MSGALGFGVAAVAATYLAWVDDGWERNVRIYLTVLAVLFASVALVEVLV